MGGCLICPGGPCMRLAASTEGTPTGTLIDVKFEITTREDVGMSRGALC